MEQQPLEKKFLFPSKRKIFSGCLGQIKARIEARHYDWLDVQTAFLPRRYKKINWQEKRGTPSYCLSEISFVYFIFGYAAYSEDINIYTPHSPFPLSWTSYVLKHNVMCNLLRP